MPIYTIHLHGSVSGNYINPGALQDNTRQIIFTQKPKVYTIIAKNDDVFNRYIINNDVLFREIVYWHIQYYSLYNWLNAYTIENDKNEYVYITKVFDIIFKPYIIVDIETINQWTRFEDCLNNKFLLNIRKMHNRSLINSIDWKLFDLDGLKKYFLNNSYNNLCIREHVEITKGFENDVIICPVEDKYDDIEERIEYLRRDLLY